MAKFVKRGNLFSIEHLQGGNLIEIAKMEDGKLYLHNGHHRCVAIAATRKRDYLDENEYYIKDRTYSQYNSINFDVGYVTPHDVRIETRVPDLETYKEFIGRVHYEYGDEICTDIIRLSRRLYCTTRRLSNVYMLADNEYVSYMGNF